MARIYLETSFVSACVTTRSSLRSRYERESSLLWWVNESHRHELFVSDEVLNELSHPKYPNRDVAVRFIETVPVIAISMPMNRFATVLMTRRLMPQSVGGDALYVAIAAVSDLDFVLTWNVKHLANPNKRKQLSAVCAEFGYNGPIILRPDDMRELDR